MTSRSGGPGLALIVLVVACGPESKPSQRSTGASGASGTSALGGAPGAGSGGSAAQLGGEAGSVDEGNAPEGPWPCTASAQIAPPAVPVRGTVTGNALQGTLCAGGLGTFAQDFTNPDTGEVVTALVFVGPGNTSPRFQFERPTGTGEANLEGRIGIGSGNPQPGTFTDEDSCGSFLFAADVPSDTLALYTASAASNCEEPSIITAGSWSLTLTSITPFPGDSAGTTYVPHGTLALTLKGSSAQDAVQASLEF